MEHENTKYTKEDELLFSEIAEGRTFDHTTPLPPIYNKALKNLLWMQGDSEYAGALGYMPWIEKAPTIAEKVIVAQMVKDEMRHAHVIYHLLEELGEDPLAYVQSKELGARIEDDQANIGFKRYKDDKRVNIFYYDINYWEDYILFNFLMDRAAGHQLEDTLDSSYTPWKRSMEGIMKEEKMHLSHGDKWVKILGQDDKTRPFLQTRLNLWWPRVMNVFGNSKGQSNDIYVRLGLKKRTNLEVRKTFVAEIEEKCREVALVIPSYNESEQPQ